MRKRTKLKLKFYASLVAVITLTLVVGIFFGYIAFLAWQIRYGLISIRTELFATMAAVLFIMCVTDIILFFYLVMKRKY